MGLRAEERHSPVGGAGGTGARMGGTAEEGPWQAHSPSFRLPKHHCLLVPTPTFKTHSEVSAHSASQHFLSTRNPGCDLIWKLSLCGYD